MHRGIQLIEDTSQRLAEPADPGHAPASMTM